MKIYKNNYKKMQIFKISYHNKHLLLKLHFKHNQKPKNVNLYKKINKLQFYNKN